MTATQHMSLSEALRVIAEHHPHWHVWQTPTLVWGTRWDDHFGYNDLGPGVTLSAPTPERLDQVLAAWEHKHGWPA